ncbi:YncE family protein [Flexivirga sp. ID2601S]|uniref:YncE family protein n=1 Tax=Flexivirga aerilata TaxID=1656889 RepID=A0A849AHV3_9MICO|nr:YncE family protein [Flexivirga aerilata]NNG39437.1 YncE family protein [Flexivirga aerilata]
MAGARWRQDDIYVRRRRMVLALVVLLVVVAAGSTIAVWRSFSSDPPAAAAGTDGSGSPDSSSGGSESSSAPKPPAQDGPSSGTTLQRIDRFTGGITPKSVDASQRGLVIANNMMYSHTVTLYDSRSRKLLKKLPDSVDLSKFGINGHPGISKGAPVEAAWTKDGKYAYVSQYTMYGTGFGKEGWDDCTSDSGVGSSYLYRFNADTMDWDQVIPVGAVPKYVAITPDQSKVVVSNWCDFTISVVDRASAKQTKVIKIGQQPRGIVILPDNRTAYVAAMYGNKVFKVDLQAGTTTLIKDVYRPRHLVLSPDAKYVYLAASGTNTVYKIDTATDKTVAQVISGPEPRSMTISADGTALYTVNYFGASVSKISTADMKVVGRVPTDESPIGITYDDTTRQVWVACYGGSMLVFDDCKKAAGASGSPSAPATSG